MSTGRLAVGYFEKIYAQEDDPWGFESAWYERRKQALTMALLPSAHYACAFEPGCASGELTRLLASRADRVIASELVPRIASRAESRLSDLRNVEVRTGAIPDDWPSEALDLVLLSEVAYYVDAAGLEAVADRARDTLLAGGHLVAVHYLGETDYPLTGAQVHEGLERLLPDFTRLCAYIQREFAALVLQK